VTLDTTRRTLDFASIVSAVLVLAPSGAQLLPLAISLAAAQLAVGWRDGAAVGGAFVSLARPIVFTALSLFNLGALTAALTRQSASDC